MSSSRRSWLACVWQQLGQALRRCHTSKCTREQAGMDGKWLPHARALRRPLKLSFSNDKYTI